jgi:hypothetical protein
MTIRFITGKTILSFAHEHNILTTEVVGRAVSCALEYMSPRLGFGDVDIGVNPALFPSAITTFDNEERSDRAQRLQRGLRQSQYEDGRLLDVMEFNLVTPTLAKRLVDGEKFAVWAAQRPGCSAHMNKDEYILWKVNAEYRSAIRRKLLEMGMIFE